MRTFRLAALTLGAFGVWSAAGCAATYRTPGAGVSLQGITDADIKTAMSREPAAQFPARLAIARVQGEGYYTRHVDSHGRGRFSVVTTPEVETAEDFAVLEGLPQVAAVCRLNRLILPPQLNSDKDLRASAAVLKADILLLYTFDTRFRIDEHDIGPLGLITLGFLPVNEAIVNTTASAAFFDVRTGFVYGLAEASARATALGSAWSSHEAADRTRVTTEREAFEKLMAELPNTWRTACASHAGSRSAERAITAGEAARP